MTAIAGIVAKGAGRGNSLGFPTFNLPATDRLADGIYISETLLGKKNYPSVTFIGAPKMFAEKTRRVETYILDFKQDLYGQKVKVSLIRKIRDNETFETVAALVKQIEKDIEVARAYFRTRG